MMKLFFACNNYQDNPPLTFNIMIEVRGCAKNLSGRERDKLGRGRRGGSGKLVKGRALFCL